jgi:hypothetical protein
MSAALVAGGVGATGGAVTFWGEEAEAGAEAPPPPPPQAASVATLASIASKFRMFATRAIFFAHAIA